MIGLALVKSSRLSRSARELKISRLLVTGGAGYVGSHFIKVAFEMFEDLHVVVVDDLRTGYAESLSGFKKNLTFCQMDLSDTELLETLIRDNQLQAVVHFAASSRVGESQTEVSKYWRKAEQCK
jgi:UDP-glucose 4-epimerase